MKSRRLLSLVLSASVVLSCGGFVLADTDPVDADPADTDIVDTNPIDPEPSADDPVDSDPVDPEPLPTEIVIDENNFPDAVFRGYILDKIDTDDSKSLSSSEIEATTEIDFYKYQHTDEIGNLQGIQYFTNLRQLYCYTNSITTLDLSNNTRLEVLYCDDNNLTSLVLPSSQYLYALGIDKNPNLSKVDISGCPILVDTFRNGTVETYENRTTIQYNVEDTMVGYMRYDTGLAFTVPDQPTVDVPTFVGHSVQLSGTIGLQFFVQLPTRAANPDDYYMTFTNAHGHIDETHHYLLVDSDKASTPDTYMVQINLSSIMMAEDFTPTIHCGDSYWVGNTYSLEDYIIWGNENLPTGSREYKVVRALADYCYYAQPYLSRINEWDNDSSRYTRIETHYRDYYDFSYIVYGDEDYAIQVNNLSGSGISAVNYSLRFGDTLSIRVYLTPASASAPIDGDRITVTGVEGTEGFVVNKSQSGERFAVTISNIPASHLHMPFTITYGNATIVVSPMSYIYGMLTSTSTDIEDDARMLVSALYYYEEALHL